MLTSELARPPVRGRRAWWVFLVTGVALVGLYQLLPDGTVRDFWYVGVSALAPLAVLAGIRLHRPARREAWYALAVNQLLWSVGDFVGAVQQQLAPTDDFPTLADAFYLAGYPALALALYLLIRGRRPKRDLEGFLDSAAVAVAMYLLCWVLLARPTIQEYQDSWFAAWVAAAYPLFDVTVVALLVAVMITPGTFSHALRLLVTSVILLVTADVAADALGLLSYDSTHGIDFLWLLSYVLVGASALHPSMFDLSSASAAEPVAPSRRRQLSTAVALLVAPTVLAAQHVLGVPIDVWPIVVGSVAMKGLVFARMTVGIRQVVAANARRDQTQRDLAHQAAHDSLTGLPNRAQALELIGGSLARAQRSGALVGLLFVDLDGFKAVNDTFGHRAGDQVLTVVADRMQRVVRSGDVVARLGGDEFVALLEPVIEEESAVVVADRLIRSVSSPIALESGQTVSVGASVGVAISLDAGADPDALIVEADTAAYRAKTRGRGRTEVFDAGLRQELDQRSEAERRLRTALTEDRLRLRYLPVVELHTATAIAYEAVVQWEDQEGRLVPIPEFRSAAEQSDLIFDVDAWALCRVAEQIAAWEREGQAGLRVSVRVSFRHLSRPRVLEDVRRAVQGAGINADGLTIQVSDLQLRQDPTVLSHLQKLREMGVAVSLDDFGIGRSSVRRLGTLPLDAVKLDASYLTSRSPDSQGMLPLMVQGGQNFGLAVVVKGIHSVEDVELLRSLGADAGQGPLFGPALVGDDVSRRRHAELADLH